MSSRARVFWETELFFWGSILLSVWTVLLTVIVDISTTLFWSNVIVAGCIIGICAFDYYRVKTPGTISGVTQGIVFLLAIWLAVSPLFLGIGNPASIIVWSNVGPGIIIALLSLGEAIADIGTRFWGWE